MKSQGWQYKTALVIVSLAALFTSASVFASSMTVRDVALKGSGIVQIQLDGNAPKGALEFDYVRDIVQLSIQNATIYPAKILHADSGDAQAFNKVFAYQYAPNLVRVRFSVDGKADAYQGKVKIDQKGKIVTVTFPSAVVAAKNDSEDREKSLLAKVLGSSDVKVEKMEPQTSASEKAAASKEEQKVEEKKEVKAEVEAIAATDGLSKGKARLAGRTGGASQAQLGGRTDGPSAFRSFLAMFLVVGGLGLILVYVKRKKGGAQAKRVGDSWLSNVLGGSKGKRAYIEVMANHSLGPKQSITVVRIKDQQFVLGVTQDNVQLITQLDADEADLDVLDDPKVADSIGKLFGAKPQVISGTSKPNSPALSVRATEPKIDLGASFNTMLKSSNGAGAIVARSAYQSQQSSAAQPAPIDARLATEVQSNGARSQIRQRLQGMKSL